MPLGETPVGSEAVGLTLTVVLPLTVEEGVGAGVAVPDPVPEDVAVPVPVWLGVALPLSEMEPVLEGLAPAGRDAVGEALMVPLPLAGGCHGQAPPVPVDPAGGAGGLSTGAGLQPGGALWPGPCPTHVPGSAFVRMEVVVHLMRKEMMRRRLLPKSVTRSGC